MSIFQIFFLREFLRAFTLLTMPDYVYSLQVEINHVEGILPLLGMGLFRKFS